MYISETFCEQSEIDKLANDAATSPKNDLPEPSEAQIKSGNYKKGHLNLHGMNISIENPKGSYRKGTDRDGKSWKTKMCANYGYVKGTIGKDKDHIDIFIGPNHDSDKVFVVNQNNVKDGKFDEHKCMLGFCNHADAVKGYLDNYDKDWEKKGGIGSVHSADMKQFKHWLKNGNTKVPYKG